MLPAEEAIQVITREVFSSLGYDTSPAPVVTHPEGLASTVEIAGPAAVTVGVELPWDLASNLAALLFETTENPTPTELMRDVTGEIANMLGGNIKGLMPGATTLSLPVTKSIAPPPDEVTSPNHMAMAFDCELGRFVVTVTLHSAEETLQ